MKRKVLIIDDDPVFLAGMLQFLEKQGFEVEHLQDMPVSLDSITPDSYALVFVDLILPGQSGIDFIKDIRIRFTQEELPILLVTAVDDMAPIREALKEGANDFLKKPIDTTIALARINTHLTLKDLHSKAS